MLSINFDKKLIGPQFGRFFSQTNPVTLLRRPIQKVFEFHFNVKFSIEAVVKNETRQKILRQAMNAFR
jgi:hypothetical protein